MSKNIKIGKLGEEIASRFLKSIGHVILLRNFKVGFDEIDIISRDNDGVLVFGEVKTIFIPMPSLNPKHLWPEDNMSHGKLRKVRRSALKFVGWNQNLIDDELGWRIDLIAVNLFLIKNGKYSAKVRHYENI